MSHKLDILGPIWLVFKNMSIKLSWPHIFKLLIHENQVFCFVWILRHIVNQDGPFWDKLWLLTLHVTIYKLYWWVDWYLRSLERKNKKKWFSCINNAKIRGPIGLIDKFVKPSKMCSKMSNLCDISMGPDYSRI